MTRQHPSIQHSLVMALIALIAVIGSAGLHSAHAGDAGELTSIVEDALAGSEVPALAAVVIRRGEEPDVAMAGVRRRGEVMPVEVSDLWHIGSCTKSMTATVAACLVHDGIITWSTTIGEAFPDLLESMRPEYRAITLQQLLHMRGRVPGAPPPAIWAEAWRPDGTALEQRRRFVGRILRETEPLEAGAFEYSNQSFVIAGLMCEQAAGAPIEEILRTRLAEPLEMTSFGFGAPVEGEPCGHRPTGEAVAPGPFADNPPVLTAAGRVHLSIPDLARYARLHMEGEAHGGIGLDGDDFRRLHSRPMMTSSKAGDGAEDADGTAGAAGVGSTAGAPAPMPGAPYAMGWIVGGDDTWPRTLWHNGSNTYWYTEMWIAPEPGVAILVACNQGGDAARRTVEMLRDRLIAREARRRAEMAGDAAEVGPAPGSSKGSAPGAGSD